MKMKDVFWVIISLLLVIILASCSKPIDPLTGLEIDPKRSAEYFEKLKEYEENKGGIPFEDETLKRIADTASTFKLKELTHLWTLTSDNCIVVAFRDVEDIGCKICVNYQSAIVLIVKTNGDDFEILYQDQDFSGPVFYPEFDPDPRTILGPIDSDKANMYMLFLESKDCKDYLDEDSLYFIAEAMSSLPLGEIKYLDFAADGDCDLRDYENAKEYVFRIGDVDDNTYTIRVSKEGKILKISDPSGDLYVRPLDSQY